VGAILLPGEDILERGSMQEVANLLLRQGLLYQQAEENGVPKFPAKTESTKCFKKLFHNFSIKNYKLLAFIYGTLTKKILQYLKL
jgi:hypothetical protein